MPYIVNVTVEFDTEDEKEAQRRAHLLAEEIFDFVEVAALSVDKPEEGSISV